ncbi:MAG: damage-inducible protein DinB [Anaerolineales bacterium]|nr:damage-inducible protein DinB [Anaerolineales bacterium]
MTESFLEKLFEHNNWANQKMIEVCLALSDEQLDAEPQSITKGTIRLTLVHLVSAQQSYLRTLTLPIEERRDAVTVEFPDLQESANKSGEGLLALARGNQKPLTDQLQAWDSHLVESWVLMIQIINHATEHREQISNMLTALGATPLNLDGWSYGEATNALIPISK